MIDEDDLGATFSDKLSPILLGVDISSNFSTNLQHRPREHTPCDEGVTLDSPGHPDEMLLALRALWRALFSAVEK